jgi:hypothetical protein
MKNFIDITVTQDFVDYANNEYNKGSYSSRYNCDALLFEYHLKKTGRVQPEENWRHDFIINDMKVDVKEVNKYFNIGSEQKSGIDKLKQFNESIQMGELTHFMYYRSNRPSKPTLMQVGDIIRITPITGYLDADKELRKAKPSLYNKDSFYIDCRNY